MPERVLFDPAKLERILKALSKRGVTSVTGAEGDRICRLLNARALYFPQEGAPGTLIFSASPSRLEVVEELIHLGQYRNRGWPSNHGDHRIRSELEVEAQNQLLRLSKRKRWHPEEIESIREALAVWKLDAELRRSKP